MKFRFCGHDFYLHYSGLLFWPQKSLGIVADLHLEKGSHFAARGFFLPPYDTHATLEKLSIACASLPVKLLMILGDCFHDPAGYDRMQMDEKNMFDELKKYDPVWIKGNHDKDFVPKGFSAFESHGIDGLVFRHEAQPGVNGEVSGHFHPKADIIHKNSHITRPCLIEDGKKMILPAFGAYTGGISINNTVISRHFSGEKRVFLLGQGKIHKFALPIK